MFKKNKFNLLDLAKGCETCFILVKYYIDFYNNTQNILNSKITEKKKKKAVFLF